MNLEGIILSKNLVKSNDLICRVLLRSGILVDIMFYGGAGSKNRKSSIIEIGAMLKVVVSDRKTGVKSDIKIASEYKLLWRSEHIRYNYEAFSLVSLFCELVGKVAISYSEEMNESTEYEGIFNILTNSFFHIDSAVKNNSFNKYKFFPMFLIKSFHYLGISPDLLHCKTCSSALEKKKIVFRGDFGGFLCENCLSIDDYKYANLSGAFGEFDDFKINLLQYFETSFTHISKLDAMTKLATENLLNYLLYNFQLNRESLKSLSQVL